MMRILALGLSLSLVAAQARAAAWMGSWAASPAPSAGAARGAPAFQDQTVVQTVRLSAGGERLRVRLSNEYGTRPLVIGAARVALVGPDGRLAPGSERTLSFAGKAAVSIPPGAPMVSDAVDLPTRALSRLRISLYFPEATPECSCHMTGAEAIAVSSKGDFTAKAFPSTATGAYRAFLAAVEVEAARPGRVIVAFGDSITDGMRSTVDADRRYPDQLAERLIRASPGTSVAVVNAGISGNRVLADGFGPALGVSALKRFDRDALAVPGATHVILLEGVNDLGLGGGTSPQDLVNGYQQLIDRAHARGLKVIGGTLLPYGGSSYFRPEGEAVRQKVNDWIRTSGRFDAVIDFDAAMRDPAEPTRMNPAFQSGDWLHPNDQGYQAMAEAVDLGLLR